MLEIPEWLKPRLMKFAREFIDAWGIDKFMKMQNHASACGCVGPQDGDPLCPCEMHGQLITYKLAILQEIAPERALYLMRCKLIAALI